MKKVAVITRTQNRPLFLERAIQSVHNQTMTDFIHVIINDAGDPEPVDALLDKYQELTQGRVKVIHNKVSKGMEAASNKAITSVESQFIAIHDDDDSWHPGCLEKALEVLENVKESAGVVVRTTKVVEEIAADGKSITRLKEEPWMPDMKVVNLYRQCLDNQMTPITFIYRRSAGEELGLYDESLPVLGDWDFGIRLLQKYDVEFLDPGFSLAFYHHRKFVAGSSNNNSFGSGTEKHRYYSNKLMNKYLRQELQDGRLGVGYVMSKLKYNQSYAAGVIKRILPGFITSRIKKRVAN